MGGRERSRFPSDLVRGRSRFQAWRARRQPGSQIPEPLWTLAVDLAKRHGVSRTAIALGLDYYSLQQRFQSAVESSADSAFVELPAPIPVSKQCVFELADGAGASMRVQLMGYDVEDLEVLSRSFWKSS